MFSRNKHKQRDLGPIQAAKTVMNMNSKKKNTYNSSAGCVFGDEF